MYNSEKMNLWFETEEMISKLSELTNKDFKTTAETLVYLNIMLSKIKTKNNENSNNINNTDSK